MLRKQVLQRWAWLWSLFTVSLQYSVCVEFSQKRVNFWDEEHLRNASHIYILAVGCSNQLSQDSDEALATYKYEYLYLYQIPSVSDVALAQHDTWCTMIMTCAIWKANSNSNLVPNARFIYVFITHINTSTARAVFILSHNHPSARTSNSYEYPREVRRNRIPSRCCYTHTQSLESRCARPDLPCHNAVYTYMHNIGHRS